ncbi:putative nucleoside-diphosphate-sugar epimerase [Biscogniauxia mediterranea]|nr:putative nucleoside-diphosphate-sugar epimerase [Biscogniauxia mediterranea]
MKLIISGATGFVGREVLRQSLSRREITSVVALARRPVAAADLDLGPGADPSKLTSVVVPDYDEYPDAARREFAGAAACIWTVAITPTKSKMYDFEEVRRVCQTSALAALRAMREAAAGAATPAAPFRFLYVSGAGVERSQGQGKAPPRFYGEYLAMRGETENKLLALASELGGVEVGIARPGLISAPGAIVRSVLAAVVGWASGVPSISVTDLAAVMLDQVIQGLDKEPLMPADLARLAAESGPANSGRGGSEGVKEA